VAAGQSVVIAGQTATPLDGHHRFRRSKWLLHLPALAVGLLHRDGRPQRKHPDRTETANALLAAEQPEQAVDELHHGVFTSLQKNMTNGVLVNRLLYYISTQKINFSIYLDTMNDNQEPKSPQTKLRVGILCGGKSAEHEISLQSAKNVLQAIDKQRFEPVLIGIDKQGIWHINHNEDLLDEAVLTSQTNDTRGTLLPNDQALDVIFPVLHGPLGEDGATQGYLELINIPYVGSGVLGSAIGMDKDVMKRLLRDADIAITDFEVVTAADLDSLQADDVVKKLGLPLFVKPANMGSSVGVSKVDSADALKTAIQEALHFDLKVLIEKAVVGDEIECAVLGNTNPRASVIGRIIPKQGNFYSYKVKYIDEDGAALEIPANIPQELAERAQATALHTFKVLACEGMARVDMFARQDGTILVNEVNTIPGFTKISMYPKLWEASSLSYTELITQLITLALERFEARQKLQTNYQQT